MKLILLTFLMISPTAFAVSIDDYNEEEIFAPLSQKEQAELKSLDQSTLKNFNDTLGIMGDEYNTQDDNNRLSFAYQFSHDYEDFTKVQSIDLQYMHKLSGLSGTWLALQVRHTNAKFSAVSDGQVSQSTNPNAEGNIKRQDQKQMLTIAGLGLGYRFKIFTQALESDRFFEMVTAYLNYAVNSDDALGESYKGYAYTADYGIHYRSGPSFFYGGKFTYTIAELHREAIGTESRKERNLNFGFLSLGFELGYFY